jgi:ABC-type oligopeptide transport system substrate-binding subunit
LRHRFGPASPAAAHGRQQYFINPALGLDYFYLNTHRSLFSNVKVRQAVNYAIDRRALAALGNGGQALPDRPADHYLPPGMAGYRDTEVYPLTPDLAKARLLMAQAHVHAASAVLYTLSGFPGPEQAQIVKNDLAKIGIRVTIRTFGDTTYFARLARPGEPFDLAYDGWTADYPDPDEFLNNSLTTASTVPRSKIQRHSA